MTSAKVTSSGIIRNSEKPRVGVINANSCSEWIFDTIYEGIDLTREEAYKEFGEELKNRGIEQNSDEWQEEMDHYEYYSDSSYYLFGDWIEIDGKYGIDPNGEYAATFSSDSNIICVEYSKWTTPCHHTSPCYVMRDGSGPCGDLNTVGDSVIAYTLPPNLLNNDENE